MAKLPSVIMLQLLFGNFRLCLLQSTSSDLRSVRPGENITLRCDITADYEITWYHQSSDEMKLLVSARRSNKDKTYFLDHITDEHHYDGTDNTSTVDLVIIGVNETDAGLYYCGGRNGSNSIQFGKAIRINFTDCEADVDERKDSKGSLAAPDPESCRIVIIVLMSVCLLSVLMNFILSWMICYRVQGKSNCWRNTNRTPSEVPSPSITAHQELEVQYASPIYITDLRKAPREHTASDLDVTYARISQPGILSPA